MINIYTTWIRRKNEPTSAAPELVHAWDEYSIDENEEGYEESRQAALEAVGDDLQASCVAVVMIDTAAISQALDPSVLRVSGAVIGIQHD